MFYNEDVEHNELRLTQEKRNDKFKVLYTKTRLRFQCLFILPVLPDKKAAGLCLLWRWREARLVLLPLPELET